MLPQSFINQVKNATDMVKLAQEYTELKKTGDGIWQGMCPHPDHKDTNPSFTVWEKEQSWCCLGCHNGKKTGAKRSQSRNYGSDCFAFLQWISNGKIGWKQAILQLAKEHDIPVPSNEHEQLYKHKKILAESYTKSLHGKAFNYLVARGLSRKDMTEWMLGFDGQKIVFPLLDRYKNVLGFTKRWLDMPEGRDDKYRNSANSKIFNKGYYFYGMHLFDDSFDEIRITEGSLDVILAAKYGVKNIVATLGTAFTEGHVEIIKKFGKVPVFCMDGDPAGLKSMRKSIEMLADAGIYSKILIIPNQKDMADIAVEMKEDLEQYILDHSVTYGYYKIQNIVNLFDAKTNELKLKLYPDIIKLLEEIPSDERVIIKEYIKNKLQLSL